MNRPAVDLIIHRKSGKSVLDKMFYLLGYNAV
jgi:hypothetical protein